MEWWFRLLPCSNQTLWTEKASNIAHEIYQICNRKSNKDCGRCKVLRHLASNIYGSNGYLQYWTDNFKEELETEDSVGWHLISVLKSTMKLAELCTENPHGVSSGEFAEIIDDFRRYASMINRLIYKQISSENTSQLVVELHRKIEQDCVLLLTCLSSSDKEILNARIPQVDYSDLNMVEGVSTFLGSGTNAAVFWGFWEGSKVALKVLNSYSPERIPEAETAWILQQKDASHILKLLGQCERDGKMILILELMDKHIGQLQHDSIQPVSGVELILQIAKGMRHLHKNNVLHRDVKPSNILLQRKSCGNYLVKIADFGECVSNFSTRNIHTLHTGTSKFMAPEMRRDEIEGRYTRKTDVYSFGRTCERVIIPVDENVSQEITPAIRTERDPLENLRKLIKWTVKEDPSERPCFEEICEELWIVMEELLTELSNQDIKRTLYKITIGIDLEGGEWNPIQNVRVEGEIVEAQKVRVHFDLAGVYCVTTWMRECGDLVFTIRTDTCNKPGKGIFYEYTVTQEDVTASDIIVICSTENCRKSAKVRDRNIASTSM